MMIWALYQLHRYTQNVLVIGFDVFGDRGGMKVLEYEIPEKEWALRWWKRILATSPDLTNECGWKAPNIENENHVNAWEIKQDIRDASSVC